MPALNSEAVTFAEYDDDAQALTLTFPGGRSYVYGGVPRQVYDELLDAPSAGAYYHRSIKGVYS